MERPAFPSQANLAVDFQAHYDQLGALLERLKIGEEELSEIKALLQSRDQEIAMLKKVEGENNIELMRLVDENGSLRRKLMKAMRSHQTSLELMRDRAHGIVGDSLDLWGKVSSEMESLKNPPPYPRT